MQRRPAPAQAPAGTLSPTQAAAHALNRLAFGPRPGEAAEVARLGWRKWAEQQLDPAAIDDSELEKRLRDRCPSLGLSMTEFQRRAKDEGRTARGDIKDELREAVLLRAVSSERQFREVIAEFWRNHFNVDVNKVPFLTTHRREVGTRTKPSECPRARSRAGRAGADRRFGSPPRRWPTGG